MVPGWESNPHEEKSPEDFKFLESVAWRCKPLQTFRNLLTLCMMLQAVAAGGTGRPGEV